MQSSTHTHSLKVATGSAGLNSSATSIEIRNTFRDEEIVPFFSIRKLRVIYHQLAGTEDFKYASFEAFKQDVLASLAPQIELSKWESLAARR